MKARFSIKTLFVLITVSAFYMLYLTYLRQADSTLPVLANEGQPTAQERTELFSSRDMLLTAIRLVPEEELPPPLRDVSDEKRMEWMEKHMQVSINPETLDATVTIKSQTGTTQQHKRLAEKITETYAIMVSICNEDAIYPAEPGENR